MATSNFNFENWLNDKLCKFINDNDNNDTSIFLNYIISLLNEEDTNLDEKTSSIETILQDLNPDKITSDIQSLSKEISSKWVEVSNSETTDNNIIIIKPNEQLNKPNENNEDPGDAILNLIKEHKNHIVESKRANRKTSGDESVYQKSYESRLYQSDDDSDHERNNGLFENRNAEVVQQREKQNRERLHDDYLKQKERIKKDQQQQKEREEERKKKARQRAAKVERKC